MRRTPRTTIATIAGIGSILLATGPLAGAAWAGNGSSGLNGKAARTETAAVTEDNDTNDGGTPNNVADDGDNRHPSGKDRSVEGGSGTQGRSTSDPDDDGHGPDRSNGGPDKPGGAGGVDLADQDGNNGCGNDDDFEDDNEGWCGNKPKRSATAKSGAAKDAEQTKGVVKVKPAKAESTPVCVLDDTMTTGAACGGVTLSPAAVTLVCVIDGTMAAGASCAVPNKSVCLVLVAPAAASMPVGCAKIVTLAAITTPTAVMETVTALAAAPLEGVLSASLAAPAGETAALAAAATADQSGAPSGSLPVTGSTLTLAAIALAILVLGGFLLRASRHRAA